MCFPASLVPLDVLMGESKLLLLLLTLGILVEPFREVVLGQNLAGLDQVKFQYLFLKLCHC